MALAATMLYEHRMDNLGALFAAAGLSPVVVKGQAVVDMAYPKNVPRLAADIDLLVAEDEEPVAVALVLAGYEEFIPKGRRFSRKLLGERPFFTKNPQLPPLVEVHRFLDKGILRPVDYSAIIHRAHQSNRHGFRYPEIEDLLLLVVLHESVSETPSMHRTRRDINFILNNAKPDMESVRERAKRWQLCRALATVLSTEGIHDRDTKKGLAYFLNQRSNHDSQLTWTLGLLRYSVARVMDKLAAYSACR